METSCLEAWQAIDLVNVQLALDEQASSVADYREACLESRKQLAQKTKAFKRDSKNDDTVLKTQVPRLLKLYQDEVDRLTQRSKFAENCFLQMYRLVREAPDPSDALSAASKGQFEAELLASQAQESAQKAQEQAAALLLELERSEKQRKELQEKLDARKGSSEDMMQAIDVEAIRQTIESEVELKYQDELDEFRTKAEEEITGVNMQLEMAQSEIERYQEVVRSLSAQLESATAGFSGTLASHRSSPATDEKFAAFENKCKLLEEENQTLVKDLEVNQEEFSHLQKRFNALLEEKNLLASQADEKSSQLSALLEERSTQLAEARKQLSDAPSQEEFDNIRNQLLVIQHELYSVEYDGEQGRKPLAPLETSQLDGLEAWFVNSTRQLKKDLLVAKRKIEEQERELSQLKKTEEKLNEALKDQIDLSEKLERDLSVAMGPKVSMNGTSLSVLEELTSASSAQSSGEHQFNEVNPLSDSGVSEHQTSSGQVVANPRQHQALQSMLQAVCSQRDRLRSQLQSEEERFETQRKRLEDTERKIKTLEEDNLQLYQRIRFLQNYKVSERSTLIAEGLPNQDSARGTDLERGSGSAVVLSAHGGAKVGGLGRGVEHKYRNLYESDISPLQAFQKQETERLYKGMPAVERLAIRTFNAFLTRSRGRVFLVVYSVLLHLLVLACIF